jgi:hypothetical protein
MAARLGRIVYLSRCFTCAARAPGNAGYSASAFQHKKRRTKIKIKRQAANTLGPSYARNLAGHWHPQKLLARLLPNKLLIIVEQTQLEEKSSQNQHHWLSGCWQSPPANCNDEIHVITSEINR